MTDQDLLIQNLKREIKKLKEEAPKTPIDISPLSEYVERDKMIVDFCFDWDDICPTRNEFLDFLKSRKSVRVAPVRYAHWCNNYDSPTYMCGKELHYYDCSECGSVISDWYGLFPFCPYCGAKMGEVGK